MALPEEWCCRQGRIFAETVVAIRGALKISPSRLASSFHLRSAPLAAHDMSERLKATECSNFGFQLTDGARSRRLISLVSGESANSLAAISI